MNLKISRITQHSVTWSKYYLAYVLLGLCAIWPMCYLAYYENNLYRTSRKMWKNVQRNPTKRHLLSSEIRTPSRPRRFGPSKRSPLLEMHHGWRENSHPCPQYSENGTNRLRRTNAVQTQKNPQESDHHSVCLRKCRCWAVHIAVETQKDHKSRTTTAFG